MRLKVSLIFLFVVCLVIPIFFLWFHVNISSEKQYGIPDLIYFTSQIVAALATLFAVVVALFGDYLKTLIYGEKCDVCLVEDSFIENLANTANSASPEAQSYDCLLKITNSGSREIINCKLLLKEVKFRKDINKKYKTLGKMAYKPLYWDNPSVLKQDLVVGDNRTIPLFKIYPKNSCQTPDDSSFSPLRVRIIGCQLKNNDATKSGYWIMSYEIHSSSRILCSFELEVWWDGTWHNRISEMINSVSATLKISKL